MEKNIYRKLPHTKTVTGERRTAREPDAQYTTSGRYNTHDMKRSKKCDLENNGGNRNENSPLSDLLNNGEGMHRTTTTRGDAALNLHIFFTHHTTMATNFVENNKDK